MRSFTGSVLQFGRQIKRKLTSLPALVVFAAITIGSVSSSTYLPGSAIWVADHTTVFQVDPHTNTVINAVSLPYEITDIAADPADGSLWVLAQRHLYKFDDRVIQQLETDLKNTDPNLASPDYMALNANDSSLWVVAKGNAAHLDQQGNLLSIWQSPHGGSIDYLAIDMDSSLWILNHNRLLRVTDTGTVIVDHDVSPWIDSANRIIVDSLGDVIWLANDKELIRVVTSGGNLLATPVAISDPAGIQDIALNTLTGKLYAATNNNLYVFDRSGDLNTTIPIPANLKPVEAVSVDPVTGTIWLGTKKAAFNISETGAIIAEVPVNNELEAITSTSASVSPAPVIALQAPVSGSLINNATPLIHLKLSAQCGLAQCDPGSTYYKRLSLNVLLNGASVGHAFNITGQDALYTPTFPLPEGQNFVQAQAIDMFGRTSNSVLAGFTIDTTPPNFLTLEPGDGSVLSESEVMITGSIDDATATVSLENLGQLGGTVIRQDPLDFAFSMPLQPGDNIFTLVATDPAGNETSQSLQLTLDIPLTLTVVSPANNTIVNGDSVDVTGVVQGLPGRTVVVNATQAVVSTDGSFIASNVPLISGLNELTITASDPVGKTKIIVLNVFSGAGGWGTARQLSTTSAGWPQVSMVGCNNGLVTWQQKDINGKRQFVDQFVAGGGWTGGYPISPENIRKSYILDSVVDSDDNGKAMVAWNQYFYRTSGGYKLSIRELDLQNGWGVQEELGRYTSFIDLDINRSGDATVIRDNYSSDHIRTRHYQSGSGWQVEDQLTENLGYRSYHYPKIAKAANGDAVAIWMNRGPYGGRYVINASHYTGGQWWSPAERISIATDAWPTTAWHPELAMDDQGNAIAVWLQTDIDQKRRVYANYYQKGIGWGIPKQIDSDPIGAAEPQVAMDPNGNATVVWLGNPGWIYGGGPYPPFEGFDWGYYGNTVWSARFAPGQDWSQPQQINGGQGVRVFGAHIASNNKGDLATIWYELRPKDRDAGGENIHGVWVATSKSGNETWSTPELIGEGHQHLSRDYYRYRIGLDDCGNVVAAWMKNDEVWANTFSTVVAGTVPIVDAPDNIVVEATDVLTPVDIGTATATDGVDGTIPATPNNTGPFPLGTTIITWTATNSEGRTGTAVQTVTVIDTTPPKLTVPQDISVTYSDPTKIPASIDIGEAITTDIFKPVSIINNAPETFDLGTTLVTWTATDGNGNETKAEQTVTVSYNGELYVKITSPANYANIDNDTMLVEGDWLGPINTGITVNGKVAETYGRHFYINQFALKQGDNTLTATASILDGQTVTDIITVSSQGIARPYDVSLTPEGGVAPLLVGLSVTSNTTIPIYKIWIDFDGDGRSDYVTEDASKTTSYSYAYPGVYRVDVGIMDMDGGVYYETLAVVVNDPNHMDTLFTGLWDGMNNALLNGNVEQAIIYLDGGAKRKYQPVFEVLLPHMSDIVASYSRPHQISISSDIGEYAVTVPDGNRHQLHLIYFLRNADGVWRLNAM